MSLSPRSRVSFHIFEPYSTTTQSLRALKPHHAKFWSLRTFCSRWTCGRWGLGSVSPTKEAPHSFPALYKYQDRSGEGGIGKGVLRELQLKPVVSCGWVWDQMLYVLRYVRCCFVAGSTRPSAVLGSLQIRRRAKKGRQLRMIGSLHWHSLLETIGLYEHCARTRSCAWRAGLHRWLGLS